MAIGCASTGRWDTLPARDQDAFQRCWTSIQHPQCGDDTDSVYVGICRRKAMATYSEHANEEARRRWLLSRGCPPPMVRPEQY